MKLMDGLNAEGSGCLWDTADWNDHTPVNLSKNPYLDAEYLETRTGEREIQNVTGKYKAIWTRQSGKCRYCGQSILADQRKAVVAVDTSRLASVKNLAYIHEKCRLGDVQFIETDDAIDSDHDIQAVLESLSAQAERGHRMKLKFSPLAEYFHALTVSRVTLSFAEISKILGEPLCASALKYPYYWYRHGQPNISECWFANGYKITDLDLERKRATFIHMDDALPVILPHYLQERVPPNCKAELEYFFAHLKTKYGL